MRHLLRYAATLCFVGAVALGVLGLIDREQLTGLIATATFMMAAAIYEVVSNGDREE